MSSFDPYGQCSSKVGENDQRRRENEGEVKER